MFPYVGEGGGRPETFWQPMAGGMILPTEQALIGIRLPH